MSILSQAKTTLSVPNEGFYSLKGRIKGRYWLNYSQSGEFATIDIRATRNATFSMGFINLVNGTPQWGHFKGDFLSRSELQTLQIS